MDGEKTYRNVVPERQLHWLRHPIALWDLLRISYTRMVACAALAMPLQDIFVYMKSHGPVTMVGDSV